MCVHFSAPDSDATLFMDEDDVLANATTVGVNATDALFDTRRGNADVVDWEQARN